MVKKLDLELLQGKTAKYPSEIEKEELAKEKKLEEINDNGKIQKKLARKKLIGKRVIIKASETTLWEGNPRNFSRDNDIEDLLPLIEKSGGNTQAVDARLTDNDKVEIIAGSRRRRCCIEAGLDLVIDLYEDMTDADAMEIAEIENSGRKEVDIIGECDYLYDKYLKLKSKDPAMNVEIYSRMNGVDRTLMHLKFSVAKLPDWLKDSSKNLKWSIRNLKALTAINRQLEEMNINQEQLTFKLPLSTPNLVISSFKKMLNTAELKKDNDVQITRARNGSITIKISNEIPESKKDKILNFIESLN